MLDIILRLTWSQTRDYFDIDVENTEFAVWFVDQCNNFKNLYGCYEDVSLQNTLINELQNNMHEVNCRLKKINFPEIPIPEDLYSQHNLNNTHSHPVEVVFLATSVKSEHCTLNQTYLNPKPLTLIVSIFRVGVQS